MKILCSAQGKRSIRSIFDIPGAQVSINYVPFPVSIFLLVIQRYSDIKLRLAPENYTEKFFFKRIIKELVIDLRFHSPYFFMLFKLFIVDIKITARRNEELFNLIPESNFNRLIFARSAFCDIQQMKYEFESYFIRRIQREGINTPTVAMKNEILNHIFVWRVGGNTLPLRPIQLDRLISEHGESRQIANLSDGTAEIVVIEISDGSVSRGLFADKNHSIYPNSPYYETEISTSISSLVPFFDKRGTVRVFPPRTILPFETGVFGGFNSNYYHFTWEVAPRLISFYEDSRSKGVPVFLNRQIPDSLIELVKQISGHNPVLLGDNQQALIKKLFVLFDRRYSSPVDFRDNSSWNIFASRAEDMKKLRELSSKMELSPPGDRFRKVFVGRPEHDSRVPSNLNSIREHLFSQDFHEVAAESMSLGSQISMFRYVEEICIITGAAVTNLVYCENLRKLVILVIDQSPEFIVFWEQYCLFLGLEVTFLYSQNQKNKFGPISIVELSKALR